ncbi:MAG: cation:proton antiporter [Christensenellaceae bacterium]|nr:cation:proton antiporter [Christensenellaceae bacterium]
MLTSLALIFLVGLALASVCQRLRLPRIIGMLVTGVLLGPYALNLLDSSILSVSADLRQMALVIILIKAGLSLNLDDLRRVGRPALLMAFLPALFEIAAFVLFAPLTLGVSPVEAAVMGAVLGAVSPAVVVPRMVQLMDEGYGTDKGIPQLILAGASLDDVFVIVLFSSFVSMAQGGGLQITDFASVPVSIALGVLLGAAAGFLLAWFFEANHARRRLIRNSAKVMIVLGVSFLLLTMEDWLEGVVPVSGLLAVMSMALLLAMRSVPSVTDRLREKYGKLWLAAEVILFVLVGAAVDIRYTLQAGGGALLMIAVGLVFRCAGVYLCMLGTALNRQERLYCIVAYLPKATVQAAIGSVPLALGLPCGNMVLSVAVLSILITAPLGAVLMDATYRRWLHCEKP